MEQTTQSPVTVTDARGRVFGLKRPKLLTQIRFVEMLGDAASNQTFMGMVLPALYVVTIDGEEELYPTSRRELDALLSVLDEDGYAAVAAGIAEHFAQPSEEKAKASLKN